MAAGQTQRQNLNNNSFQRGLELAGWQMGRVLSYTFMGLIAGAFGAFFINATPVVFLREIAFIAANLILIALGLHVAQLWSGIVELERLGQLLWRAISPMAEQTLIARTPKHRDRLQQLGNAIRAGAIWGWLPCGLVYSMLVTASVSGSAQSGALWMLAFGLGTMPALWITSMASDRAVNYFQRMAVRRTAGLLIIAFGLWGLLRVSGVIQVDWLDAFCIGTRT